MTVEEQIKYLLDIFQKAAATDDPHRYIFDEIEKIQEVDPSLWSMIEETKQRMLTSMNNMTMDEKIEIIKDWQTRNGNN